MITWPPQQPTLQTQENAGHASKNDINIRLRPLSESDSDAIYQACQDPLIPQFTRVPSGYDREMALDFVRACQFTFFDHASFVFAIDYLAPTSQPSFAGTIGLHSLQQSDHMGEVGYWIEKSHRGKGIATLALELMSEWVMSEMGFRRLEALADVGNIASHRVLEKAGFTREATLKKRNTRPDGNQIDMALYSKVDS